MSTGTYDPALRAHSPRRGVFETTDLGAGRDFLSAAYGSDLRLQSAEHDHFVRHERHDCGSFAVDELTLGMDAVFDVGPLGSLAVFQPTSGRMEHEWQGGAESTGPGDVAANPPPHMPYTVHVHNAEYGSVSLDQRLLMATAGFTADDPDSALRFTGMRPASPGLADQWRTTVAHVRSLLKAGPDAVNEPLVIGNLARSLAVRALATFPNTGDPEPTSADGADATPRAVRRAIGFMEANAEADLGVGDMAAAAHVSPSALRMAFARHHHTTPFGHLRNVRMVRAHFDLLDAERAEDADDGLAVAAVAARWGFANPADFEAYYRHLYGVSPHETIAV